MIASVGLLTTLITACEPEKAPNKEPQKQASPWQTTTSPSPYPSRQQDEQSWGGSSDESQSQCDSSARPEFSSTGGSGTVLQFVPGATVSWRFSASDDSTSCRFEVFRIESDQLPQGISVTNNESRSVGLSGITTVNAGSTATSGTLTVTARNMSACARQSSLSSCRQYEDSGDGASYDVTETFQWTMDTSVTSLAETSDRQAKDANRLMLLSLGVGVVTSLLGGAGQPFVPNDPSAFGGGYPGSYNPGIGTWGANGAGYDPSFSYPGSNFNQGVSGSQSCISLRQYQCQTSGFCSWDGYRCTDSRGGWGGSLASSGWSGSSSCNAAGDRYSCEARTSCRWDGFSCEARRGGAGSGSLGSGLSVGACSVYTTATSCNRDSDCTWAGAYCNNRFGGSTAGASSCYVYTSLSSCSQSVSCRWTGYSCEDSRTGGSRSCSRYATRSRCDQDSQCSWDEYSGLCN